MSIPKVTWADVTRADPRFLELEQFVRDLAKSTKKSDRTAVWYRRVKPVVCELAGWSRGRLSRRSAMCLTQHIYKDYAPGRPYVSTGTEIMAAGEITDRFRTPAATDDEKTLRTSAAYDAAYDHLLALLMAKPARRTATMKETTVE